ncbi:MAG: hypothetical protein ACFCVD_04770 [Nodosilinea sp.]
MAMLLFRNFWCLLGVAMILGTGCRYPVLGPDLNDATLTLEVTPTGPGEYELKGTSNLPHKTQLTVIALRYLEPSPSDSALALEQPTEPLYSILAYRPTVLKKGQWNTQLALWQVAEDGRYQEPWQAQAETLGLELEPADTVQFAVALAPRHIFGAIAMKRMQPALQTPAALLRTTDTGEPFLWVDQALSTGLPTGQTSPPDNLAAQRNGGWGERYRLVPEPPLPYTLKPDDKRQTTAPLGIQDLLQ